MNNDHLSECSYDKRLKMNSDIFDTINIVYNKFEALNELYYFLQGYIFSLEKIYDCSCDFNQKFTVMVKKEFEDNTDHNWQNIILFHCPHESLGIKRFLSLVEKFKTYNN